MRSRKACHASTARPVVRERVPSRPQIAGLAVVARKEPGHTLAYRPPRRHRECGPPRDVARREWTLDGS